MILNIKRNDSRVVIEATLKDFKGEPVNLSGAIVTFIMVRYKSTLINRAAEIVDPLKGTVIFHFNEGETSEIGKMNAEFKVEYPDKSVETFPNQGYIDITIEEDLPLYGITNPPPIDDDTQTSVISTWSANKISFSLEGKANTEHSHNLESLMNVDDSQSPVEGALLAFIDGKWKPKLINIGEGSSDIDGGTFDSDENDYDGGTF